MAYYTGSAANLAAVLSALTTACETEGWTWSGGVLSKADPGIFVRFDASTAHGSYTPLRMWGRSAIDSGEMGITGHEYVCMGIPIKYVEVTYPVTYHAFVFTDEVFFVINYSDKYQWLAFGQSDQGGLNGTGNWVSATSGYLQYTYSTWRYPDQGVNIGLPVASQDYGVKSVCPAIGWSYLGYKDYTSGSSAGQTHVNTWVDAGFDATDDFYPWTNSIAINTTGNITGIGHISELISTQPNAFNNEGVLLPIKVIKKRPESKYSQVLQVQNARHIRIDNYSNGEIIQLGTDYWKVFPWYCKNTSVRSGGSNSLAHSGTFGWAIKYETA